jgi:hypothetical protein
VALFCEEYLREADRVRGEAWALPDDMRMALAKVRREQARFICGHSRGFRGRASRAADGSEKAGQRLVAGIADAQEQEPDPIRLHKVMAQIHRRKVADLVRAMTQEDDAGMAREGSGT